MVEQEVDGDAVTNDGIGGFARRAFLRAQGRGGAASRRRPIVGICSSWSELNPCNGNLRALSDDVKRGIVAAGGQAYEFPTISLAEQFVYPTSMILRNLMAMDVEEMIRRSPIDAVVLLAGCDKTVPAQLMGAASAGRPAIMLTAGPRPTSRFRSRPLVTDDFWDLMVERRSGGVSDEEWSHLEAALCSGLGVCNVLGTATTMAMLTEALGMSLPGSSLIGATDARRSVAAEDVGHRAVALAHEGTVPSDILTAGAFSNALRVLAATGGSTNAVIHIEAIAGRVGVPLGLEHLAGISAETPLLTSVRPAGPHLLEDLEDVGGVPAVMAALRDRLHLDARTVGGSTIDDVISDATTRPGECLRPLADPFQAAGGIGVVRGNLAPNGALIKRAAASEDLWTHEGPALVFESATDASGRSADPLLDCDDATVLIVRGAGPIGGPGMPELGQIPIPVRLRSRGVTDMVCVTDARVSGTQKGATVLHASPESALGGAFAAVSDGDMVRLDATAGQLTVDIDDDEVERRMAGQVAPDRRPRRGYEQLYFDHVLQADEGCDFDFLRHDGKGPTT